MEQFEGVKSFRDQAASACNLAPKRIIVKRQGRNTASQMSQRRTRGALALVDERKWSSTVELALQRNTYGVSVPEAWNCYPEQHTSGASVPKRGEYCSKMTLVFQHVKNDIATSFKLTDHQNFMEDLSRTHDRIKHKNACRYTLKHTRTSERITRGGIWKQRISVRRERT